MESMQQQEAADETENEIRAKLRQQLDQSGMSSSLKKMVRQICNSKGEPEKINPEYVVREVYKRGLMRDFMDNLDKVGTGDGEGRFTNGDGDHKRFTVSNTSKRCDSDEDEITRTLRNTGKYYLKVEILGGKAFLDNLLDEDDMSSERETDFNYVYNCRINRQEFRAQLKLHVFYKSQRFTAKPVDCCCDPDFKGEFLIEIGRFNQRDDGSIASELLDINEPLRIMVVREDINLQVLGGSLVAYCLLDWRSILITKDGLKNFPLELMGIGPAHSVCVGILHIRLRLVPTPRVIVEETAYLDKVNDESATQEDCQRSFVAVAKRWWNEYIQIRADHQLRLIRLFTYDEKMVARPIMTFVKPVIVDDLLDTPFQAAWFVALLPTNENNYKNPSDNSSRIDENSSTNKMILPGIQNGTGGCLLSERWQSVDSTIVSKSGTTEDHAVLLTSLLLSFGLDAYVALGTKRGKGSWAWTVVLCENKEPTCWESTTGDYYEHYSCPEASASSSLGMSLDVLNMLAKNKAHNFATISCMFNNKNLYANVQPTTSMDYVDWNLENPSKWKHLSLTPSAAVVSSHPSKLSGVSINWNLQANILEYQLKEFITSARKDKHLSTKWDHRLSQFMGQHLHREELQVNSGGSSFKGYFETVAMKELQPGYEFKAHTFHSTAAESHILFTESLQESVGQEIIFVRGDDIKHSLKVKVFPYPEDIPSIRFMIACHYIPTD